MGPLISTLSIAILMLLLLAMAWAFLYNGLVEKRNQVANAFAQIDVQLKRRHDLIPNLVKVAERYLSHERQTLEAVIAARNQAQAAEMLAKQNPQSPSAMLSLSNAEGVLNHALGRLMMVVESYPELKADRHMRDLHEEIASTENRIGFARQAYNDAVQEYNDRAVQFPGNLIAALHNFTPMMSLTSTDSAAERQAPAIQFSS